MPRWLKIVLAVIASVSGIFVFARAFRDPKLLEPLLVALVVYGIPVMAAYAVHRRVDRELEKFAGFLSPDQQVACRLCAKRIARWNVLLVLCVAVYFVLASLFAQLLLG